MSNKDHKEPFCPPISEVDAHLWRKATEDVKKLNKEDVSFCRPDTKQKPTIFPAPLVNTHDNHHHNHDNEVAKNISKKNDKSSYQIDKATAEKLRRGKLKIEARIDLHGMTQGQAYDVLVSFLINCHKQGKRCVLVITGKGRKYDKIGEESGKNWIESKPGILREKLPLWLGTKPLNEIILKTQEAKAKDGGSGATYVLIRKNRIK